MVKEEDRYRCALALMLSNMLVRAMISQKLGVNQLPLVRQFILTVEIRHKVIVIKQFPFSVSSFL